MPLVSIDDTPKKQVPHGPMFRVILKKLGETRAAEVRAFLNDELTNMEPDSKTKLRTFSSSHLGSKLSPWPHPLSHLYFVSHELMGENATEKEVQDRAGMIFGQFVWECVMNRSETWAVWDPNLGVKDPNRELMGKVYFERG